MVKRARGEKEVYNIITMPRIDMLNNTRTIAATESTFFRPSKPSEQTESRVKFLEKGAMKDWKIEMMGED